MITVSLSTTSSRATASMRAGRTYTISHNEYSALSQPPSYGLLLEQLRSRSITHTSGEPYYNLPKRSSRTILSNPYITSSYCKGFIITQLGDKKKLKVEKKIFFSFEYVIFAILSKCETKSYNFTSATVTFRYQ